jgi:hypothetical protein
LMNVKAFPQREKVITSVSKIMIFCSKVVFMFVMGEKTYTFIYCHIEWY